MNKHLTLIASGLLLCAGTAMAGEITTPVVFATQIVPPSAAQSDWSGFYAGGSIGFESLIRYESVSTDPNLGLISPTEWNSVTSFGGFAGYNFQSDKFVYGGEISISSGGVAGTVVGIDLMQFETSFDLKARAGYSFGDVLAYGVIGGSFANLRLVGGASFPSAGFNFGAGLEYKLNEHVFIGAEYLVRALTGVHELEPAVSATSTLQSAQLRVGWKF